MAAMAGEVILRKIGLSASLGPRLLGLVYFMQMVSADSINLFPPYLRDRPLCGRRNRRVVDNAAGPFEWP